MTCPMCGGDTTVIDTRSVDDRVIRRRRKCKECSYRFTTIEHELEEDIKQ